MTMILWPLAPPAPQPLHGALPVEVSLKHLPQPEPHHDFPPLS